MTVQKPSVNILNAMAPMKTESYGDMLPPDYMNEYCIISADN